MNLMLNTSSLSRSLIQVLLTCLGHWDGFCVKFLGQLFTCLMFWVPACDSSHWSLQLPLKTDNLGRSPQTFVPNTWTTSLFALVVLTHLDTCGHLWTFVDICQHLSCTHMVKWNAQWTHRCPRNLCLSTCVGWVRKAPNSWFASWQVRTRILEMIFGSFLLMIFQHL